MRLLQTAGEMGGSGQPLVRGSTEHHPLVAYQEGIPKHFFARVLRTSFLESLAALPAAIMPAHDGRQPPA
jgi:hypothetical protein